MRPASLGSHLKRLRPAAAHSRPLFASGSHVCGPMSVFSDAHVAGKNGSDLIRGCGRELCEAFLRDAFLTSRAPLASPFGRGGRAQRGRRGQTTAAPRCMQKAARPSQSPSVTALPEGEPRRLRARKGYLCPEGVYILQKSLKSGIRPQLSIDKEGLYILLY